MSQFMKYIIQRRTIVKEPVLRYFARCNTTYSGGQASDGQGGFYGSLKSRSETGKFQPGAKAEHQDIKLLNEVVEKIRTIENKITMSSSDTDKKLIHEEIKEALDQDRIIEMLKRLQVSGSPVWGLSVEERRLVKELSEKVYALKN